MNLSVLLKTLSNNFVKGLSKKTAWGRNEVISLFKDMLSETLIDLIGNNVNLDLSNIQELENVLDNNAITDKQKWVINKIEEDLKELNIKFNGKTKYDAISFIREFKDKKPDDLINNPPF